VAPGNYRISYVNGALRYNANQGWRLNAHNTFPAYYVEYNDGAAEIAFPGTVVEYGSQTQVEAANAGASIDIVHTGGSLGMYLHDGPIEDNVAGSPNPTFRLTLLTP
jgi:hypothetical protein